MKTKNSLQNLGFALCLFTMFGFVSCTENGDKKTEEKTEAGKPAHAEANIEATFADTVVMGMASFDEQSDGKIKMVMNLVVPDKAGKSIAVHIHEHGDCGDSGKNAHGHWNPTKANHGQWGTASFHSGDIGNITLDAEGKGSLEVTTDLWTIGGDEMKNILGKAMMVHGGTDDYSTQPTGNAGGRIGCGIIKQ